MKNINIKISFAVIAAAVTAAIFISPARASSLWAKREQGAAYLYSDNAASQVGDLLTVLIAEESSFASRGSRNMDKSSGFSGDISASLGGQTAFRPFDAAKSTSRQFQGGDQFSGSREFTDSITVTVVDRLPNGNLIIAGRSERYIAGEEVVTIVTGMVKPRDIDGRNTISSRRLSHARIYYETKGPSQSFVKQGYAGRILNFIWPF